ncbi:hypothetical protein J056_003608 [Wallemia ichthyophaga EXF-994]|uniref:CST complex subunit Stn1 N-terminal domain-containing protein n=1 Tax=Wallemia ichthyophaga (strain EXF-994 / CBS 113033) TaxID=1299270 RepID=R9AI91_WALI9|nr:uncharacterized protein J056_003608 [Wallemia ichthyophaga EXF-994]EOR01932.1 hypothetical protein J056_003608 [Wallemia ichthyophaga EXF-994]TIB35141.1 hypothetical protein E3P84_01470 [Wallemia ichthyophaga]TIB42085.1 hypothetical protein E3P83_01419 [Wallemia ichthyophaga]
MLNNQPFKFVVLFGYLLTIELKFGKLIFYLEDGTDVIRCFLPIQTDSSPQFSIADAVSITGKLDTYNNKRIIYINSIAKQSNLNLETHSIALVDQAVHNSHSFILPSSTNLIKQSVDSQTRPRKKPKLTSKLSHPSKLSHNDLTPHTFEIYMKNFINLNSQHNISILSLKLSNSLRLLARRLYDLRHQTRLNPSSSSESKHAKIDRLYTQSLNNLVKKGELIVYDAISFDSSSIELTEPPSQDEDDPLESDLSGLYEHYKCPSGPLLKDALFNVMSNLKHQASLQIIHNKVTNYQENLSTLSQDSIQIGLDWLVEYDYASVTKCENKPDKYKLTIATD